MRLRRPVTSMYVGLLIANCKYVPKAKQVIINRMTMDEDEVAPVAAKTKHSYQLIKEKLDLCLESKKVMNQEKKLSFRQFCHNHSVAPSILHVWKPNIKMLKEPAILKKSSNKTLNKGNPTLLHHIKDAIMEWIDGKCEKGLPLSTQMVILQVSKMDPTFHDKRTRSR